MPEIDLTFLQGLSDGPVEDSRYDLALVPVNQFRWWIYLWFVALHTIVAVILTELMGRTYGKPLLWFALSFLLPLVGPVTIFIYHIILSTSVTEARKQTFWERVLVGAPVSLQKMFFREHRRAQEAKLSSFYEPDLRFRPDGADPEIDKLLQMGKFQDARAHAWKMLEVAKELNDRSQTRTYQQYLEIIAEQQSLNSGREINAPPDQ